MDKFEQALGVGDGQGSLVCYSPWWCKELDMTEQLNHLSVITDAITVNLIFFPICFAHLFLYIIFLKILLIKCFLFNFAEY